MTGAHRDEWFLVASDDKLSIKIKDQVTLGEDPRGNLTLESRHESERWITLSIDPAGELVVSGLHEGRQIEGPGGWTSKDPGVALESGMCLVLGENQVCLSQRLSREKLTQELLVVPARDSIAESDLRMEPPPAERSEDSVSNAAESRGNVVPIEAPAESQVGQSGTELRPSAAEAKFSEEADPVNPAVNRLDAPGTDEVMGSNSADGAETKRVVAAAAPRAVGIAPVPRRRSFAPNALAISVSLANRDLKHGRVIPDQPAVAPSRIETGASDKAPQISARASLAAEQADLEAPNSVATVSHTDTRPGKGESTDGVAVGGHVRVPRRRISARTALAASIALIMSGYWVISDRNAPGEVSQQQSMGAMSEAASGFGAVPEPTLIEAVETGDIRRTAGSIAVGINGLTTTVTGADAAEGRLTVGSVEAARDRFVSRDSAAIASPDRLSPRAEETATVAPVEQFSGVIREAESLIAQGYINWPERSAVAILGDVLAVNPGHLQAGALLNEATARYLKEAEKAYADGFHQAAIDMLMQAQSFHPTYRDIDRLRVLWELN